MEDRINDTLRSEQQRRAAWTQITRRAAFSCEDLVQNGLTRKPNKTARDVLVKLIAGGLA
jgi:hypothetical protein